MIVCKIDAPYPRSLPLSKVLINTSYHGLLYYLDISPGDIGGHIKLWDKHDDHDFIIINTKYSVLNIIMFLRRLNRAVRRIPIWIVLLTIAPFIIETLYHQWQYEVARPSVELDPPFFTSCQEPDVDGERENAVFVMMARNRERRKAKKTIESIEKNFNQWFKYPIVFLNDQPWDDRFVTELNETAGGKGIFEVIPQKEWTFPDGIDVGLAKQHIKEQGAAGIPHAGQEGYHHMCRFYSG